MSETACATELVINTTQDVPPTVPPKTARANSLTPEMKQRAYELAEQGLSQRAIGRELGIHHMLIARLFKRDVEGRAKQLGVLTVNTREEIHKKIFEFAPQAVEIVQTLAQGAEKQEVRLKASADMLDRAGFAPVQKVIQLSLIEEMSREELINEISRLIDARINTSTPLTSPTIYKEASSPSSSINVSAASTINSGGESI